jgi:phosphohistidine phosphatase
VAVEQLALFLGTSGVEVIDVFHSGKTRAAQTAEIFARSVSASLRIEPLAGLLPNDDPDLVLAKIAGFTDDTMLVGHLPHMRRLLSRLLLDSVDEPGFEFRPATAVCLRQDEDGAWILEWFIQPDLLGNPDLLV